jgi:hypothetical protein
MCGDGHVRAHEGTDSAAGALLSGLLVDLGWCIAHAVDAGGGLQDSLGAEGDAELAALASFGVDDDIA